MPISDLRADASMTKMRKISRIPTAIENRLNSMKKAVTPLPTRSARSRKRRLDLKNAELHQVVEQRSRLSVHLFELILLQHIEDHADDIVVSQQAYELVGQLSTLQLLA